MFKSWEEWVLMSLPSRGFDSEVSSQVAKSVLPWACSQLTRVDLEQSSGACGAFHCLNFPLEEQFWNSHTKPTVCDYLSSLKLVCVCFHCTFYICNMFTFSSGLLESNVPLLKAPEVFCSDMCFGYFSKDLFNKEISKTFSYQRVKTILGTVKLECFS